MLKSTCFAVLLVTAAAAGAAQAPSAPPTQAAPPAAPAPKTEKRTVNNADLDKVVCEKQDKTGSRLGARKICMTVAQWLEFRRDEQDQLQHLQSNIGVVSH
jgi:3-oxoacyl-ACP reductase-like protein